MNSSLRLVLLILGVAALSGQNTASSAILSLHKSDGVSTVRAGERLTYTLTYTNSDSENAAGVVITDTLPNYVEYIGCAGCEPPGESDPEAVIFYLPTITQTSGQVQLFVQVEDPLPAGADAVINTARMTHQSLPSPIIVSDVDAIDTRPDLTISANHSPSLFSPGKLMTYTVTYGNAGGSHMHAEGVKITTTLPSGTEYVGDGWDSTDGQTYTYPVGELLAGFTGHTITFTVRHTDTPEISQPEFLTPFAITQDGGVAGDANAADNTEYVYIGVPDLVVADFIVEPIDPLLPDVPVTFTVVLKNQGTGWAWNPDNYGGFYVEIFIQPIGSYPFERNGDIYTVTLPIAPGAERTIVLTHDGFSEQEIREEIEGFYVKVDNWANITTRPWTHLWGLVPEYNEMNNVRVRYAAPGDAYEPDDVCTQASALATDGTVQQHTFHQQADEDWAHFTVVSGTTYVVQATSTSPGADLELELYDACDGNLEGSDDTAFGTDARLVFTAPSSGTYYVRALNHDPATYGPDVTYELSVRTHTPQGIAIIVAGRLRADDYRQPIINGTANLAYQTFLNAGFPADNILYLNADLTQPGVDDAPSWANVRDAIQDWARGRVAPGVPLWVYLADHGNVDRFHNDVGQVIAAAELDLWLSNLEAMSGVDQVNVIIDACHSGSFIDTQQSEGYGADEISGPGRVVVASTSYGWFAYAPPIVSGQPVPLMYFSDGFWHALGESRDIWNAFLAGRATVEAAGQLCGDYAYTCQRPWLDDNGDAWFDEADGDVARGRGLAVAFGDVAPYIDWVEVGEVSEGHATIRAQVRDDGSVARVWARVFAPSFAPPESTDGGIPVIEVPEEDLTAAGDDVYQAEYAGFAENGVYQVVVYAVDDEGNAATPRWVFAGETAVYLPLVQR